MFDNGLNIQENETQEIKKEQGFVKIFTDEELANIQSKASPDSSNENVEVFEDNGVASPNPYLMLKAKVESALAGKDYEERIVALVDALLLNEQNALNEDSKKKIALQKYIFGLIFTNCNYQGDQKNFLYLMADRLGVRR